MVDTTHINLLEIVHSAGIWLKRAASTNGGEYAGRCPLCGGRDRFRVWAHPQDGAPRVWCRGCGFSGDAIEFAMKVWGLDFAGACTRLGVKQEAPKMNSSGAAHVPQPRLEVGDLREYECFSDAWQASAKAFVDSSAGVLWDHWEQLPAARYLESRGITLEAAISFMIGYNHEPHSARWGSTNVFLPRGITIPWEFQRGLWNVRIRRPQTEVAAGQDKYTSMKGAANGLYNADLVTPGHDVILTEGEFDAIVLDRVLLWERLYNVRIASIGNVTGARVLRWVTRLALARRVYLAFDADEPGEKAAAWWKAAIGGRARRLVPEGGKDATEVWQAHGAAGVVEWVKRGLLIGEAV